MRNDQALRFAVLGFISCNPAHGWDLKKQSDKNLGEFWQTEFGEIYRVLDNLAKHGFIEQLVPGAKPNRKIFRITDKGKQSLDDFILAPPTDAPRPMRQELAVKLLFAGPERLSSLLKLISHQRQVYMKQLGTLEAQRRKLRRERIDAFVTGLLIDCAELQVRAELAWLDDVARKLKERFGRQS